MKKKYFSHYLFSLAILFSIFFSFPFFKNEKNIEETFSSKNINYQNSSFHYDVYQGKNINLQINYINSEELNLIFTIIDINPEDVLSVNYKITEKNTGNKIDNKELFSNNTSTYSITYSTEELKQNINYNFDVEIIYKDTSVDNQNILSLNENFNALIPEYEENIINIDEIEVINSVTPYTNDASIEIKGTVQQEFASLNNQLIFELKDVSDNHIFDTEIVNFYGTQSNDIEFDVLFSNLDSLNIYSIYIYSSTTHQELSDALSYDYLDSILNIEINNSIEKENEVFYSQINYSEAISPNSAKITLYSKATYLLDDNLQYSLNDGEKVEIKKLEENFTELKISNLDPDTNYTFKLYSSSNQLLDESTFSTYEQDIVDVPLYEIEKYQVSSNSVILNYYLEYGSLIDNLQYSLFKDGEFVSTYQLISYHSGFNYVEIDNLEANTEYTVMFFGTHKYDQTRKYIQEVTFTTAKENFIIPSIEIYTELSSTNALDYHISKVDPSNKITNLKLQFYGANTLTNNSLKFNYINEIDVINREDAIDGNLLQNIANYDNVYILVEAMYLDEYNIINYLPNNYIYVDNQILNANQNLNIDFVTREDVQSYEAASDSLFSNPIQILILSLLIFFFIVSVLLLFIYLRTENEKESLN